MEDGPTETLHPLSSTVPVAHPETGGGSPPRGDTVDHEPILLPYRIDGSLPPSTRSSLPVGRLVVRGKTGEGSVVGVTVTPAPSQPSSPTGSGTSHVYRRPGPTTTTGGTTGSRSGTRRGAHSRRRSDLTLPSRSGRCRSGEPRGGRSADTRCTVHSPDPSPATLSGSPTPLRCWRDRKTKGERLRCPKRRTHLRIPKWSKVVPGDRP